MENTGYLDIHTHILPGIDDGSKDWSMTEEMLRMAYAQGIRTIVATPHNYPGETGVKSRAIKELCEKTEEMARRMNLFMRIFPGNEIFYREGIAREIEKGEILSLAGSRYLLVEFHPGSYRKEILNGLRELTENGYLPIIAHVERVEALFGNEKAYTEALNAGCYMQTNCASLLGSRFDKRTRRLKKLLGEGKIHFLGSDCHNVKERRPLMQDVIQKLSRSLSEDQIEKFTAENVKKFLKNEYI